MNTNPLTSRNISMRILERRLTKWSETIGKIAREETGAGCRIYSE